MYINPIYFTTIVSRDHLFKLLAMHTSLCLNCPDFRMFILCADEVVHKLLQAIPLKNTTLFEVRDVEDERVARARFDRIFHAFCWTLKPVFLHYVLERFPTARYYAHVDGDLCFYSNPDAIFAENPDASLYLTHHRNSLSFMQFYPITGIYNTGFVGLKRDDVSRKAIKTWKDQCLSNCPIKEDPVKRLFGDQRYVEDWPNTYPGVHVVRSLGANTAMWNIANYHVSPKGNAIMINGDPLIFYHFSGLSIFNANEFNLSWFMHIDDEAAVSLIYRPYLKLLNTAIREVGRYFPWFHYGFVDRSQVPDIHYYRCAE